MRKRQTKDRKNSRAGKARALPGLLRMIGFEPERNKGPRFRDRGSSRFIQKLLRPADRSALYEFADAVTKSAPHFPPASHTASGAQHIVPETDRPIYDAVYPWVGSSAAILQADRR